MFLGKHGRGPIKRTTSMTGINMDLGDVEPLEPSDSSNQDSVMMNAVVPETASPRWYNHKRRSSGGYHNMVIDTAPFLRTCGLCNRRLKPKRDDIFMYRGDMAFCSIECREQQIKHDERIEKSSVSTNPMKDGNQHHHHRHSAPATATATTTSQA